MRALKIGVRIGVRPDIPTFQSVGNFSIATAQCIIKSLTSRAPVRECRNVRPDPDFVAVLNRIVGFNKYKPSDFLPPNGKSCKIVKSVKKQKLNYTVTLDDQVLLVDASCAPVKIELPSFQSFACVPRHLQIKNISKCHKKVRVSTSNVVPSAPLDFVLESGKVVVLQWQALASLDEGKWVILK